MNFVIIMTDTQCKHMVGAYGRPEMNTPNLDRLSRSGVRFDKAYTACPVCTPARSSIFSGLTPQVNGAWTNNVSPHSNIPLMGEIFRNFRYRAGYTGKWHLDGTAYYGDGQPGGGFEPDWWYDGKCYAGDIGPEMFRKYLSVSTPEELEQAGFTEENIWGHRVADRALDFLERVGGDPFLLVVSFDEPHAPYVAPAEYWRSFCPDDVPRRPNYDAPVDGKPELQQVHHQENKNESLRAYWQKHDQEHRLLACNSYIDREIGRVIDAVETLHGDDTTIIYTSDHGDMMRAHGLRTKGPMMYEEVTNIPLIIKTPECRGGEVSSSPVSHLDILPTLLDMAGMEIPPVLHGYSLTPILSNPERKVRDCVHISFNRFAINQDTYGGFYPIRCVCDGRYKLAVNLLDTDELYDLENDPYEMENLITHNQYSDVREKLHCELLKEMGRTRDPFRSFHWGMRPWSSQERPTYWVAANRDRPDGFSFQPSIRPDGFDYDPMPKIKRK